jgi:hypothetical protein
VGENGSIVNHDYCLKLIQDDGSETLPSFGPKAGYGELDGNWLWKRCHAILVLSIPFYKGSHAATHPKHFLPIIKFLHNLHVRGLAHGDIRCFNILFVDDQIGFLIDLDYAGEAGKAKYPLGYAPALIDGNRKGKEKELLRTRDDWVALRYTMCWLHQFSTSDDRNSRVFAGCSASIRKVAREQDSGVSETLERDLISTMGQIATNSVWERTLEETFEDELLLVTEGKLDGATGSLLVFGIGDVD